MDPIPSTPWPRDLRDLSAVQLATWGLLVGLQAALLGRIGLVLPALGALVTSFLWFRRRLRRGTVGRARVQRLALGSAAVHAGALAAAYLADSRLRPTLYEDEPLALGLGALAMGLLGAFAMAMVTLCAGDAARATGPPPPKPGAGRPPGQPLSLADRGLGPPPDSPRPRRRRHR